jgi:hypothetical protein
MWTHSTFSGFSGALLLVVGLPFLFSPSLASAQEDDDPDSRAYRAYTLTMPKYKKFFAASANLANAGQRNPEVKKALQSALDVSLEEAPAHFDRVPEARRALADAGLTPREFMLIFGVSIGAKMANHMIKKEGTAPAAAAEESGITQAQLDFYRKNETEIARLEKEAEARAPALKIDRAQETGAAQSE